MKMILHWSRLASVTSYQFNNLRTLSTICCFFYFFAIIVISCKYLFIVFFCKGFQISILTKSSNTDCLCFSLATISLRVLGYLVFTYWLIYQFCKMLHMFIMSNILFTSFFTYLLTYLLTRSLSPMHPCYRKWCCINRTILFCFFMQQVIEPHFTL